MSTLAASPRITPPLIAAAAQTVFMAAFPVIDPTRIFFQYERAGVYATTQAFALSAETDSGFTLTLDVALVGGETCFIYSQLTDARDAAYIPGGAIRSTTLEEDFTNLEAQMQEHARDLGRGALAPFGAPGPALPDQPSRLNAWARWSADGAALLADTPAASVLLGYDALKQPAQFAQSLLGGGGPVTGQAAALAALEVAAGVLRFATVAQLAAADLSALAVTVIQVLGYSVAGDCPVMTLVPTSAGAALGKFESADGQWFTHAAALVGYPEWFGAEPFNPGFDCRAAFTACVVKYPITQLQAKDYWFNDTWKINTPHRKVRGFSFRADGAVTATRLLVQSATHDCVQVGPDANPGGGPNSFLAGVEMSDMTLTRSVTLTPPGSGYGGPAGLRVQYALLCFFDRLQASENSSGFFLTGTVGCHFTQCVAFRSVVGTTGANDYFHGFHMDNTASIGLASGNASVYVTECNVSVGAAVNAFAESSGLYVTGGFTDTFLSRLETSGMQFGLNLNAPTGTDDAEDMHVISCIFDQCWTGVSINALSANTAISLTDAYVGLTSDANAVAGYLVHNSLGAVNIVNGQVVSGGANTGAGLSVQNSSGVRTFGNIYTDLHSPIVLHTASLCVVEDTSNNATVATANAAVTLTGCTRCKIQPTVLGAANATGPGVSVDAGSSFIEVNCTAISPTTTTSAVKLSDAGTPVTAAGVFATNCLASGIVT